MRLHTNSHTTTYEIDYRSGEEQFNALIHMESLDQRITETDTILEPFERILDLALKEAFTQEAISKDSRLFLQRVLYRINRLKLFWYDDLKNYTNESSPYIASVRSRIDSAWQKWELSQIDIESLRALPVKEALQNRIEEDLSPEPSEASLYFRDEMTEAGYNQFLKIASLDGLVEASQLSRILGGVGNEVQSMLTKIFLEEYGGGKLARKHSSYFSSMMKKLGITPEPEAYFDLAPWEVLVNTNHSFVLCELKRNFLRYIGGLLYTEISVPAAFKSYSLAGERLGLGNEAIGYWELHIKEDQRHGQWMIDDVALPLVDKYGDYAWEIIWGYDQQRFISARASQAIVQSLCEMETD